MIVLLQKNVIFFENNILKLREYTMDRETMIINDSYF